MSSAQPIIQGACNCGAVEYKITGKHLFSGNCHCQDCREAHGSPYTHVILYKYDQVEWIKGVDMLGKYDRREMNKRTFCKNCGCPLCSDLYKKKIFAFFSPSARVGSFPPPAAHIYTKEADKFQRIPDDKLPRRL